MTFSGPPPSQPGAGLASASQLTDLEINMSTTPEPDVLADLIARCPEHGTRTESWPECRCAAARQAADVLAAASGVQPDTRPEEPCVHYLGGTGKAVRCTACQPDAEQYARWDAVWPDPFGTLTADQADAVRAMKAELRAVADEEQRDLRAELADVRRDAEYFQGWAEVNGKRLNTALAENAHLRRAHKSATKALAELRAELERARAAEDLLQRAESYLSALHGSVARHDNLGAGLGCAGCELRDQIAALRTTAARSGGQAEDGAQQK